MSYWYFSCHTPGELYSEGRKCWSFPICISLSHTHTHTIQITLLKWAHNRAGLGLDTQSALCFIPMMLNSLRFCYLIHFCSYYRLLSEGGQLCCCWWWQRTQWQTAIGKKMTWSVVAMSEVWLKGVFTIDTNTTAVTVIIQWILGSDTDEDHQSNCSCHGLLKLKRLCIFEKIKGNKGMLI